MPQRRVDVGVSETVHLASFAVAVAQSQRPLPVLGQAGALVTLLQAMNKVLRLIGAYTFVELIALVIKQFKYQLSTLKPSFIIVESGPDE